MFSSYPGVPIYSVETTHFKLQNASVIGVDTKKSTTNHMALSGERFVTVIM